MTVAVGSVDENRADVYRFESLADLTQPLSVPGIAGVTVDLEGLAQRG